MTEWGRGKNTFTAIAKTGKEESCLEDGRREREVVTQQPSHTDTVFLHHPLPKTVVSVLSLWSRLCSNMKMESDKGGCCAGTWEIQEIYFTSFYLL